MTTPVERKAIGIFFFLPEPGNNQVHKGISEYVGRFGGLLVHIVGSNRIPYLRSPSFWKGDVIGLK